MRTDRVIKPMAQSKLATPIVIRRFVVLDWAVTTRHVTVNPVPVADKYPPLKIMETFESQDR